MKFDVYFCWQPVSSQQTYRVLGCDMNGTVWKRGEAWPCFLRKKCVYVFHMFCLLSVPSEYIPEPEDYIWESYHLTGNTFSWFPFLFKIFVDLGQHTAYLFISYSSFILLLWQNNKKQLGGGKQIRFVWLIFPGCRPLLRETRVGLVGLKQSHSGKLLAAQSWAHALLDFLYSLRAPDQGMLLLTVGWTFVNQSTIRTISHQPILFKSFLKWNLPLRWF